MSITKLFDFAVCPKYNDAIKYLAENIADKECWDFNSTEKGYKILKNYIDYTFRKLYSESKIIFSNDNKFACFNTGLNTPYLEDIFMFFEKNRNINTRTSYDWCFKAFIKESDNRILTNFTQKPPRANYFEKPENLIFNASLEIIPDLDHIISDNLERFPTELQENKDELRRRLIGAIDEVKKKVRTNYKIAIPQYFNGEIQLLLPLNLTSGSSNPDLALVIYKAGNNYSGRTCLTLKMAYTNARLIVKPQSEWLKAN
ncbi:MAG: DUF3825 domain-containing protein [Neisseria sp.]|uniref:DUF3825 domain-containing protein n=1 Tax=Neisseria sp. TaxID=192066 RepID=UPI0026DB3534|nr:DUF3825 domain-containing protein [Neisseria sp.]MDO4641698.1 DUF3825 domain-containing protein [Neisseria sp.]